MRPRVLFLVTLLVPLACAASAKECLNTFYQGSNAPLLTGRYQDMAKDNAVITWGGRVLASIGPAFSNWEKAEDRSFVCAKQGRLHKCTARARPCAD